MNEKDLIKLWNEKRSQIITAQIAPTLMLIGIFVLAGFDKFATASDGAKYLAIGVAAVTTRGLKETDMKTIVELVDEVINNHEDENMNQLCECNICYDEKELKNFVKLTCNHEFCKDCIINTMKTMNTNSIRNLTCAFCRKDVKTIESRTNDVKNEFNNYIE